MTAQMSEFFAGSRVALRFDGAKPDMGTVVTLDLPAKAVLVRFDRATQGATDFWYSSYEIRQGILCLMEPDNPYDLDLL